MPARFASGMAVHPSCGWQLPQPSWSPACVGDSRVCHKQASSCSGRAARFCTQLSCRKDEQSDVGLLDHGETGWFCCSGGWQRGAGDRLWEPGAVASPADIPSPVLSERPGMASGIIVSD